MSNASKASDKKSVRQKKLATALRANLKRRKAAKRAVRMADKDTG